MIPDEIVQQLDRMKQEIEEKLNPPRSKESILSNLIASIAGNNRISGVTDPSDGMLKLSQLLLTDKGFGDSVNTIVDTILLTFPIKNIVMNNVNKEPYTGLRVLN